MKNEVYLGEHEIKVNGINLSSEFYFYQLKADDPSTGSGQRVIQTKKRIYLK